MLIEIDATLTDIAHGAVVRLRTLAPNIDFALRDKGIEVGGDDLVGREDEIRRLIETTLYQQRIYHDTLRVRERIYNG